MTLLLLLSAMLSALTGVSGGARAVETPALAAQVAQAVTVEAVARVGEPLRIAMDRAPAPLAVLGAALTLAPDVPLYHGRRRE